MSTLLIQQIGRKSTLTVFSVLVFVSYFRLCSSSYLNYKHIRAGGTSSENSKTMSDNINSRKIRIVFSDVDGTLVHYPSDSELNNNLEDDNKNQIIALPPSSTGMRGVISSRTLQLAQDLRQDCDVKFVLVSGMRTSTLIKRLPYLPRADAYCCEAGGRVFYPIDLNTVSSTGDDEVILINPIEYTGASDNDLKPFGIIEDKVWRSKMEKLDAAGKDGYEETGDVENKVVAPVDLKDRKGLLWSFARLLTSKGFVVDWKGYATCFRVNKKQQTSKQITNQLSSSSSFTALLLSSVTLPKELATSVNLGCVDFYPVESGKKNCCEYLVQKFLGLELDNNDNNSMLSKVAVCICDDDNDLEMALACQHIFVPSITSEGMANAVKENPDIITVTENPEHDIMETKATEVALAEIKRTILESQ